jgi:hypothetical protein
MRVHLGVSSSEISFFSFAVVSIGLAFISRFLGSSLLLLAPLSFP